MPQLYVIAGPNGAGKTTFAKQFLFAEVAVADFVNADMIAEGLNGGTARSLMAEAGRITLERINDLVLRGVSFAWETTMSGRTAATWIKSAKDKGYVVKLFFFWLNSADQSIERVCRRVAQMGHRVDESDLRRRFARSVQNFFRLYAPLADAWKLYDNSEDVFRLVAVHKSGRTVVRDRQTYAAIKRTAEERP
jgi:predicted ABC-type ATPase